ncbi:type I-F CRISPR-associated endoribonuclease Cas6/Csy4 [Morganella psychrotolerans]|uniref:type I-F CRISPR-associated endoribonuclease Cas6/Csy4 n=1 Tax=Morganella psychrotolerans TaxID=368603 RepID=UPI0039AFC67F
MNYYQTITILPEATVSPVFIRQKVWQRIHIALADNKIAENSSAIAVAFPDYSSREPSPGFRLRLLTIKYDELIKLNIAGRLTGMSGYIAISPVLPVPEQNIPVSYIREHVKGQLRIYKDMRSKAERRAVHTGQSLATCLAELEKSMPCARASLPFIRTESSSGQKSHCPFPLFIRRLFFSSPQQGKFTCYGLSHKRAVLSAVATVPHF